jgi:DNA-binding NarL/FixJ family response regulator
MTAVDSSINNSAKPAADTPKLLRVVIADDDPAMLGLLDALVSLPGVGVVVGRARDGRETIDLVLAHNPEIALLDVEMPRLRGQSAEVIRTLPAAHTGDPAHRKLRTQSA